jgi:hypothetical protein
MAKEYEMDILRIDISDLDVDFANLVTSKFQEKETASSWRVLVCIVDMDNHFVPATAILAAIRAYERIIDQRPAESISSVRHPNPSTLSGDLVF